MTRLDCLRKQALSLPEPYRSRAMGNVRDADRDLAFHRGFVQQILDDCERAIALHEADSKQQEEKVEP